VTHQDSGSPDGDLCCSCVPHWEEVVIQGAELQLSTVNTEQDGGREVVHTLLAGGMTNLGFPGRVGLQQQGGDRGIPQA
jgi:hypothetical protein